MLKLYFYVPIEAVEKVKQAVFEAGAGCFEHYDQACWQVLGQGQFRPLSGSNPHIGQRGQLTTVSEYRVEMLCEDSRAKAVIKALKMAHPYEEPAYEFVKLVDAGT